MSRIFQKVSPSTYKAIVKNFPHIKLSENFYLFWEKPKRIPFQIKDIFIDTLFELTIIALSPFRLIYNFIKIPMLFLPVLIKKDERMR